MPFMRLCVRSTARRNALETFLSHAFCGSAASVVATYASRGKSASPARSGLFCEIASSRWRMRAWRARRRSTRGIARSSTEPPSVARCRRRRRVARVERELRRSPPHRAAPLRSCREHPARPARRAATMRPTTSCAARPRPHRGIDQARFGSVTMSTWRTSSNARISCEARLRSGARRRGASRRRRRRLRTRCS